MDILLKELITRTVGKRSHPRRQRAILVWCTLLAQLNFLWVLALHHHEALFASPCRTTAQARDAQSPRSVESAAFCAACQIVRHSAARPATGTPAPAPAATLLPCRAYVPRDYHSHRPPATFGRAPPFA